MSFCFPPVLPSYRMPAWASPGTLTDSVVPCAWQAWPGEACGGEVGVKAGKLSQPSLLPRSMENGKGAEDNKGMAFSFGKTQLLRQCCKKGGGACPKPGPR